MQYYPTSTHQALDALWPKLNEAFSQTLGINWSMMDTLLARSYHSHIAPQSRLSLLTIHKAKGLEFDHVFIIGLDQKTMADQNNMFEWHQLPTTAKETLLAPLGQRQPSHLYQSIRTLHKIRTQNEQERIRYVAYTRAKQN